MVVHTYNPNYSRGKGRQEDGEIKASWGKVFEALRPSLRNKIQTKGQGAWHKR
jgi:hypothetical protein